MSVDRVSHLVHKACVDASVDNFVQNLPQQYHTIVGERSTLISGGQRQRIAIARAIVSNPKILLLDEATSALDPDTEQVVQEALDRVSRDRTTIVIAHRLATIQKADKIVLLKDGRISEQGNHEFLLHHGGLYANMWGRQNLAVTATQIQTETTAYGSQANLPESVETEKSLAGARSGIDTPDSKRLDKRFGRLSALSCVFLIFKEQKKIRLLFLIGCLACIVAGAVYPGQAIVFAKSVAVVHQNENLVRDATFWALLWFLLAVGVCLTFFTFGTAFTIVGSNIMRDYRSEYFSSLMKQNVSFFAETRNSSAALATQLVTYTQQLETLLSKTIGFVLLVIVNVSSSCVLSIVISWKLGLVAMFGVFPLIMLAGFLQAKSNVKSTDANTRKYDEVIRYASEAVACMRTVSSLAMESEVCDEFEQKMRAPMSKEFHDIIFTMFLFALAQSANLLG